MRANHALELHFTGRKRHTATRLTEPAEEEACQLPHAVEAKAARHDWIALKMAWEIPVVGADIVFGTDIALVELSAGFGNFGDAVHHQHWWQGELCIAGTEQLAACAAEELFIPVARFLFCHYASLEDHSDVTVSVARSGRVFIFSGTPLT
ncbi:hypothetical protein FQZ97_1000470 [compost metagenome]